MSGLENRQGLLARDRAASLIGVGDQDPERALTQPLAPDDAFAEHGRIRDFAEIFRGTSSIQACEHGFPEVFADLGR